jgi:predicted metal-dependent HD superfamily phosphohydrolase
MDVDLSILGSDRVRFLEYEYPIGEEFEKTSKLKFRIGRGRFLASLLARPSIFRTTYFRDRYEVVGGHSCPRSSGAPDTGPSA